MIKVKFYFVSGETFVVNYVNRKSFEKQISCLRKDWDTAYTLSDDCLWGVYFKHVTHYEVIEK